MSTSLTSTGVTFPSGITQIVAKGHRVAIFTSSGTFTYPTGTTRAKVTVIGGGGAGGVSYKSVYGQYTGGSGGAGGIATDIIFASAGTTVTVTVGAGGSGTANPYTSTYAQSGGTSSFGTSVSATGGAGGAHGTPQSSSGSGGLGSATNTSFVLYGNNGNSSTSNLVHEAIYTPSGYAYTVGGYCQYNFGGSPGYSNADTLDVQAASLNASGYGHGGAGAYGSSGLFYGGNGAPGLVIVEW